MKKNLTRNIKKFDIISISCALLFSLHITSSMTGFGIGS